MTLRKWCFPYSTRSGAHVGVDVSETGFGSTPIRTKTRSNHAYTRCSKGALGSDLLGDGRCSRSLLECRSAVASQGRCIQRFPKRSIHLDAFKYLGTAVLNAPMTGTILSILTERKELFCKYRVPQSDSDRQYCQDLSRAAIFGDKDAWVDVQCEKRVEGMHTCSARQS